MNNNTGTGERKFKSQAGIFGTPKTENPTTKETVEQIITIDDSVEKIIHIPIKDTIPYHKHSFDCMEEDIPQDFLNSIKENGVQQPAIVRPAPNGKYEMIVGHKRRLASTMSSLTTLPVIVRNLDDIEADKLMVDSNKQRDKKKPSETARSMRVLYEAEKRQGARNDLSSSVEEETAVADVESNSLVYYEKIAEKENMTPSQARRWIECGKLPLELMRFMDTGSFKYTTGAELSYVNETALLVLLDYLKNHNRTKVTGKQAKEIKEQEENITLEVLASIFTEPPKSVSTLSLNTKDLKEIFDDTELSTMDSSKLIAFIQKAVLAHRANSSPVVTE